jgi:hypothetical protein
MEQSATTTACCAGKTYSVLLQPHITQRAAMPFRFRVGQEVEYTPPGGKNAGLYKIVRQMPEEQQAVDLKYCIKSET